MDLSELHDRLTAIQKGLVAELAKVGNLEPGYGRVIAHLNYCLRAVDEIRGKKKS